ncbi:MAG TPA: aldehyde dehydrogenase family protein, partial [Woeseiaceae bacterium]|nr:aldehyde dehydrogenase family protein [Woeseiaceae bacterium]
MNDILKKLGLESTNPGTWSGSQSLLTESAPLIESVNPATNEVIASVRATTAEEYDRVVEAARDAFREWRKVPAPVRGDA